MLALLSYFVLLGELVVAVLIGLPFPRFIAVRTARSVQQLRRPLLVMGVVLVVVFALNVQAMYSYEERYSSAHELEHSTLNIPRFRAHRDVYITGFAVAMFAVVMRFSQVVIEAAESAKLAAAGSDKRASIASTASGKQ